MNDHLHALSYVPLALQSLHWMAVLLRDLLAFRRDRRRKPCGRGSCRTWAAVAAIESTKRRMSARIVVMVIARDPPA